MQKFISILNLIEIDSPLQKAIGKLLSKLKDVLLESISFFQFSCAQVCVNVKLIYLVDGQFAEIVLGLIERFLSIELQYFPQFIGLQFCFAAMMFIALIEYGMQYFLCLDVAYEIFYPYLMSNFLVKLLIFLTGRHNDHLFESVIQMLLVIVERRVLKFFNFLLLFELNILIFGKGGIFKAVICRWSKVKVFLSCSNGLLIDKVEKLRNVDHGISPMQAGETLPGRWLKHIDRFLSVHVGRTKEEVFLAVQIKGF